MIHRGRIHDDLARRATRHHHRELELEVERLLGNGGPAAERRPCILRVAPVEAQLAPTIVAALARLDEERRPDAPRGRLERLRRVDVRVRSDREAAIGEPLLLAATMLHDAEQVGAGPHRHQLERRFERGRRDLLDLDRDDVGLTRQLARAIDVVEPRDDDAIDDGTRRAVGIGIEHLHAIAERARGERRHAAQLAATEDADGGGWKDRRHQRVAGRDRCRRARRWCARRARRAAARESRDVARRRSTRRAARRSRRRARRWRACRRARPSASARWTAGRPRRSARWRGSAHRAREGSSWPRPCQAGAPLLPPPRRSPRCHAPRRRTRTRTSSRACDAPRRRAPRAGRRARRAGPRRAT